MNFFSPALLKLYEFENGIEPGLSAMLAAANIPSVDSQGKTILTTPRVEVVLHMGAVTGHRFPYVVNGQTYAPHDTWDATLIFRTVTARNENASAHAGYRAQIRLLTQPFMGTLSRVQLPLHVLVIAEEAGTVPTVEDDRGQDISEIHFKSLVSIRNTAWP